MQMLGGFLILLGCFGMGLWYRQQFLGRLYTIRELIRILEQWISEIRYNGSTLPECCRQTGRQRKDRLGEICTEVYREYAETEDAGFLELAEKKGARVFNRPEAIRSHNEKLTIAQFPEFMVPTLVTSDERRLRAFHQEHHDVILKPLNAMGGTGVFRVRVDGINLGAIIETLTENGHKTVMMQKYIPEIVKGDKRVLLINGQVVPFALARIPQNGEIRGNLAAGGLGKAQPLSRRDREIAETLAPVLVGRGLFLVGLDLIGDWLTEVNVTSPTCFREITSQTGFDVAKMFVDELEKTI